MGASTSRESGRSSSGSLRRDDGIVSIAERMRVVVTRRTMRNERVGYMGWLSIHSRSSCGEKS